MRSSLISVVHLILLILFAQLGAAQPVGYSSHCAGRHNSPAPGRGRPSANPSIVTNHRSVETSSKTPASNLIGNSSNTSNGTTCLGLSSVGGGGNRLRRPDYFENSD
jgi:hypothetical protein